MELRYRAEIDGLRTIAVLAVLIYHAEFFIPGGILLPGGFLGVDIFFVISGFLITSIIISEYRRSGRFSLANFYERRARRLLPALLTVMLVSLPAAWLILMPTQLVDFAKSLGSSLFFGSNFYWHQSLQEYGAESALLKPFLHTWSLAVEEQYYIFFPLILVAAYRWFSSAVLLILGAGLLASLLYAESITRNDSSFAFYMLPTRFWELLAGGVLAHTIANHPSAVMRLPLRNLMPLTGMVLLIGPMLWLSFGPGHPGLITLLPVLGTVLIILAASPNDPVTRLLSSRPFVVIGLISYSLYLWHYPIFAFGRLVITDPGVTEKLAGLALTVLLSVTSYRLIETPFRKKTVVHLPSLLWSLATGALIVIAFGGYAVANKGIKERFPELIALYGVNEFDNTILKRESWSILNNLAAEHGYGPSEAHQASDFERTVLWYSTPGSQRVLVVGNSHSKDMFNAFYLNSESFPGVEVARYGMANSVPPAQVEQLLTSPNLLAADTVILAFRYDDNTLRSLPSLIETLKQVDKKVIVAGNNAEFQAKGNVHLFDYFLENNVQGFDGRELNHFFYTNLSSHISVLNARLRNIAESHSVGFLDRLALVCNLEEQMCHGATPDGYKTYFDANHWTLEGARYFGIKIMTSWDFGQS